MPHDDDATDDDDDDTLSVAVPIDDDVLEEMEPDILEDLDLYHREHLLDYAKPGFETAMIASVVENAYQSLVAMGYLDPEDEDADEDADRAQLHKTVAGSLSTYYDDVQILPRRSLAGSAPIGFVTSDIQRLRDLPQPPQRTPAWYAHRHELLTASNWYKAFGSEAVRNSLIYEKCKPFELPGYGASPSASPALPFETASFGSCNTQSPLHWGNKYEPLTRMLYEHLYGTSVEDFGCLRHPAHPHLGASPDGIVVQGPRTGYMLEIKNVFNRELTGIPKEEYWVQVQGQLEVCDLEMCDFVETRFKEHTTPEEWYADDREHKGVILYVSSKHEGGIHYIYRPLADQDNRPAGVEAWCTECLSAEGMRDFVGVQVLYWYLDEMSHVVIPRNRAWFQVALPVLTEVWGTILRERVEGYDHRAPRSRGSKAGGKVSNGLKIMFENGSRQIQIGALAEELVHVIKHEES